MGFKDKMKAFGEKVKEATKDLHVSVGAGSPGTVGVGIPTVGQTPRGPGCVHCHQNGLCFACHGTGKNGSLSCVHCDGSGICKFCGADLIRQGLKAWQPFLTPSANVQTPRGPGCIHCHQGGLCFACNGSGKNGALSCVHCKGSGICNFCGDHLIRQGLKAWQPGAPSIVSAPPTFGAVSHPVPGSGFGGMKCGKCNGSGRCNACQGSGRLGTLSCNMCHGTGRCDWCNGTGQK